ncbi:MAG: hypothetical protein WKF57_00820 [Nakamurella sp.]
MTETPSPPDVGLDDSVVCEVAVASELPSGPEDPVEMGDVAESGESVLLGSSALVGSDEVADGWSSDEAVVEPAVAPLVGAPVAEPAPVLRLVDGAAAAVLGEELDPSSAEPQALTIRTPAATSAVITRCALVWSMDTSLTCEFRCRSSSL